MTDIGIGIIGGGYMGKAHAVAHAAVGAVFNTTLRPRLEMIAASTASTAARYRDTYGFRRHATSWQELVADPRVEAVIIAAPQATHRVIAEAAFARGKPVFCEKPLGASHDDARAMTDAAHASGCVNMVGFNYVRTPATQYARRLLATGAIGTLIWFRGEHTEDFHADPSRSATWRSRGEANGTLGDLAPHMINAALALVGPIKAVQADIETLYATRGGEPATNDDQVQMMCRFVSGVMGHLYFSRTAHGRKMGYAYEITGSQGAIRFDQEDQNTLWLYQTTGEEARRGFTRILTGPSHPDYAAFCQGAGHGTGYQDQIIIEARDFLQAIETGQPVWPTFADGLAVADVIAAARVSHKTRCWQDVAGSGAT